MAGKKKVTFDNVSRKKKKPLLASPDTIKQTTESFHPEENDDPESKPIEQRSKSVDLEKVAPTPPVAEEPKEEGRGRGRPKKRDEKYYRKTSFDIHRDLYEAMEVHLFKNRKTIKDMRTYILGFIKEDLGWTDPDEDK
jgi:hypothetical protein